MDHAKKLYTGGQVAWPLDQSVQGAAFCVELPGVDEKGQTLTVGRGFPKRCTGASAEFLRHGVRLHRLSC